MALLIFGTAEPATAIMAASIPMLRVLIQPDSSSKPSDFVELGDQSKGVLSQSSPGLNSMDDPEGKPTARDSWLEFGTAEQARVCQQNQR